MSRPPIGTATTQDSQRPYRPVPPPPLPPRLPLSVEEEGRPPPASATASSQAPPPAYGRQESTPETGNVNASSSPPPPPSATQFGGHQGYAPPAGYQPMYPPQMYPQAFSPYGQLQASPTYAFGHHAGQYPQAYGVPNVPQQSYFQAPPMVGYPPATTSSPVHGYQGPLPPQQLPAHPYGQAHPHHFYPPPPAPPPPLSATATSPVSQSQQPPARPPSVISQTGPTSPVASFSGPQQPPARPPSVVAQTGSALPAGSYSSPQSGLDARPETPGGAPTALHQQPPEPYRPASVPVHHAPLFHNYSHSQHGSAHGPIPVASPIDAKPAAHWGSASEGPFPSHPSASRLRPHSTSFSSGTSIPVEHVVEPVSAPPQQESFHHVNQDPVKHTSSATTITLEKLPEIPFDEKSAFAKDALERYRVILEKEKDLVELGEFDSLKDLLTDFFKNEMNIRMDKYGLPKEQHKTPDDLLGSPPPPHGMHDTVAPMPEVLPASQHANNPAPSRSPPTPPAPIPPSSPKAGVPVSAPPTNEVPATNIHPAAVQLSNVLVSSLPSKTARPIEPDHPSPPPMPAIQHEVDQPAPKGSQPVQESPHENFVPNPQAQELPPEITASHPEGHDPPGVEKQPYHVEEPLPPPTSFSSIIASSHEPEEVTPQAPSTFSAILGGTSWFTRKPQALFNPSPKQSAQPQPPAKSEKPPIQAVSAERPLLSHGSASAAKPKIEPSRVIETPLPPIPASEALDTLLSAVPIQTVNDQSLAPFQHRLRPLKDLSWLDTEQAAFDAKEQTIQDKLLEQIGERQEAHSGRQMKLYAANKWQQADDEAKTFEEEMQQDKEAEMKKSLSRWRMGLCNPAYDRLQKAFGEVTGLHREITQFRGGKNVIEQIALLNETQAVFLEIMGRLDLLTDELRVRGYQVKILRAQAKDDWAAIKASEKEKKEEDRALLEQRREFKMEKVHLHARCVKYLVDNAVEVFKFHWTQVQEELEKVLGELAGGKREASEELRGQLGEVRNGLEMLRERTNALYSLLEKSEMDTVTEETQPSITRAFNNNNWDEGEKLIGEQTAKLNSVQQEHAKIRAARDAKHDSLLNELSPYIPPPVAEKRDRRSVPGLEDMMPEDGLDGEDEMKFQMMMSNTRDSRNTPRAKMDEPW